jgi:hypothetical protein
MVSLSFGDGPDRDTEIMMDCDLEGLQDTRHPLDQLISGKIDHSHFFFCQTWGGCDIQPAGGNGAGGVHHVKISSVPEGPHLLPRCRADPCSPARSLAGCTLPRPPHSR